MRSYNFLAVVPYISLLLFPLVICEDVFHEQLLLKPLSSGKLLSHFQFTIHSGVDFSKESDCKSWVFHMCSSKLNPYTKKTVDQMGNSVNLIAWHNIMRKLFFALMLAKSWCYNTCTSNLLIYWK